MMMRRAKSGAAGCFRVVAALACFVTAGCSTPDVNPAAPRAHTGYVDFYTDSSMDLSWKVKRATEPGGEMRPVFSEFKPIEGNVLRLAAPPGAHQFEVWFSNEVTKGPTTVLVQVVDAKVTPVHVTLTPAGATSVIGQNYEYRSTARITRRVTRVTTGDQTVFEIGAAAEDPRDYGSKEQMPYFAGVTNR